MRAAQDVTLCINVTAGKADRTYGNYANVWENFRIFLTLKVAQCLKGAWKLSVRGLPAIPLSQSTVLGLWDGSSAICGFLWPLLQCHSHGQGSGTRLQNPRVHKTPKCSLTSWAACWKQGSSATLCLSPLVSWYVSLSLCHLCPGHWRVETMIISYSCLVSITFPLPHTMFAWSQGSHKLILLYFYSCKKIYDGVSVWSRFDVPQGQGSSPELLKAAGFCFAEGAPCLVSLLCYCQVIMLPCISPTSLYNLWAEFPAVKNRALQLKSR